MSIALFGATGNIGSKIREEALVRGQLVTAVVTDLAKLAPRPNLTVVKGDIYDADEVAQIASGHDTVISAFSPGLRRMPLADVPPLLRKAHDALFASVKRAGVQRLIVVGGVGSLEASPGVDVVDSPDYASEHRGHTLMNREILRGLRASEHELAWTYVSPPLHIVAGTRTGRFRLGTDTLLRAPDGDSRISEEDFAVAILDELERGEFVRRRFTVAY